jgi:hypothetical protein
VKRVFILPICCRSRRGCTWNSKTGKWPRGAVWKRSIGNIFEHFEGFSEHGIFHGITVWRENKPLNIKDKKGLFTIERE